MHCRRLHRQVGLVLVGALVAAASSTASADHVEQLPVPRVTLSIETPTAEGPWIMVVENKGDAPARIVADARRLKLLVRPANKYETCELPAAMRSDNPSHRQLELPPGGVYREAFDPKLFCWGSLWNKLEEGTSVTGFLGWSPPPQRARAPKPQAPPFAVEAIEAPAAFANAKRIVSLTSWLGKNASESDAAQPPKVDRLGEPKLILDTAQWADATSYRQAQLTATLKNVGDRPAVVYVRPDELVVHVVQPGGTAATCAPATGVRAAVRDFFLTIGPNKTTSVQVLLAEHCPRDTFLRPGLYQVRTRLRTSHTGADYGLDAMTGTFDASHATWLRVQDAPAPYHGDPPQLASSDSGP